MGGVWCKTDKGQSRSFSPKVPFNSTITRWTNNVRQAYRKPKPSRHRPPRPPQKPLRSHNRLTISHPQLVTESSSDGWRTATLMVPEAPVPPPRKKRKCNQDLSRTAYSMDDLNLTESLNVSTISLSDKYHSESGLNMSTSSSTLVVTPIIESQLERLRIVKEKESTPEENKENIKNNSQETTIEEEKEEFVNEYVPEEIIPIEKETLYSARTLLQSSLGYVDKLSAISEVSTISNESGFEDKTDFCKSSELSGSVTSNESIPKESSLNILAHIQNINTVSQLNEVNKENREKTAISKKEWLQNILKDDPESHLVPNGTVKNPISSSETHKINKNAFNTSSDMCMSNEHKMGTNLKKELSETHTFENHIPSSSPVLSPKKLLNSENCTNHSVLLGLLQANDTSHEQTTSNPILHKEESIFLKDTKTNIIYKTLSSDKLSEIYDDDYLIGVDTSSSKPTPVDVEVELVLKSDTSLTESKKEVPKSAPSCGGNSTPDATNLVYNSTSNSRLTDYFFQAPRLVRSDDGLNSLPEEKRSNVSSSEFKEIAKSQSYESALKNLQTSDEKMGEKSVMVNGVEMETTSLSNTEKTSLIDNDVIENSTVKEPLTKKDSISSSRRSSITDSLHEFEMSIYDMLKESKKCRDSSDEDESLKSIRNESRK